MRFRLGGCDSPFDWLVSDQFLELGRLKGCQIHLEQDHNQLICSWMSGRVIERQAFVLTSNATDLSPRSTTGINVAPVFFDRLQMQFRPRATGFGEVRVNCIELHGEFRSISATDGKQLYVADRISLALVSAAIDTCVTDSSIQLDSFS